MKKGTRKRRKVVTDEAFVQAWARCESVAAVASEVGLTYSGAQARVKFLREAGVKLPTHPRIPRSARVDAAALNKLFAKAKRGRR